ncbi:NADPH:quinone reductase [Lacisediminimonas profundi]|uniref:NADPH:quinone reductase n=1 Tax=Lacisediminimonas profundi TaxID=2603856 RepID=UPI00124B8470|nr:NADPH:quinone reductase [Lacisediminimonas profundi]
MKAAWYSRSGIASEVLEVGELPTPEPGAGELRVRLMTSGVNPSDVKSRRARAPAWERIVPHSDGAGIIEAVGSGVPVARLGERVWIWNGQWQRPLGTAAEFIVLPAAQAVALPDNTDFAAGACLGIPALTAWQAVQLLGDVRGQTVLVTGAGSAVGLYAAQMAMAAGAEVIGTAGSAARAALARGAGITRLIDYKAEPVAQRVREMTGGRGADAVIDMDFSSTAAIVAEGALRSHGTIACYGSNQMDAIPIPFRQFLYASVSLRFFLVYDLLPQQRQLALEGVTRLLEQGCLQHAIGARYPLDQIVAAHEAVEGGLVAGNVVLDVARD